MNTSKAAKAAMVPGAKAPAKRELRVYVGPTINKFSAVRNRVYIGEIPTAFRKAVDENRWMANLLVLPEHVSEASRSIRSQDGAYWEAYRRAAILEKNLQEVK